MVKTLDLELQKEGVEISPHHAQFIEASDEAGSSGGCFQMMANIFDAIERARKGPIGPTAEVIDEIMCLMI